MFKADRTPIYSSPICSQDAPLRSCSGVGGQLQVPINLIGGRDVAVGIWDETELLSTDSPVKGHTMDSMLKRKVGEPHELTHFCHK